ncbi:hypothetical protein [Saccharopolyspora sp. 7B]|uniref:hypothetical protein n=1 Tax=Saccharopolyspora sp. 7B TaxID=2877240 RepID=UPI001CD543F0|nr:hypothetical protein [Saccharopolyspora sp. 7B]MCA1278262.1 hypothetical protein [Saccharopolyspora sp. 7B]
MRKLFSSLVKASTRVALADYFTAATSGALTAAFALLIEDLFPKPGDQLDLSPVRFVVFGILVLVVLAAMLLRRRFRTTAGTLLSVQVLDEGMGDLTTNEESRELAQDRAMSIRTVHRWADLPGSTRGGVIDVVDTCAEAGAAADLLVNTVPEDGRIVVAPNLLWPIALSVGGALPLAERDVWLVELSTHDKHPNEEFELDKSDLHAAVPVDLDPIELKEPSGDRVGVSINLTQAQVTSQPDELLRSFEVRTVHHVHRPGGVGEVVEVDGRLQVHFSGAELARVARSVAVQLVRIKESCGERELVVTARMPKTVAVAVGWYLAQFKCRFYRGTHLLHYSGPGKPTLPMRVRRAQSSRFGAEPV